MKMRLSEKQKQLILIYPLMVCANNVEFTQRLQWLSEGMLYNHLNGVRDYHINYDEIKIYNDYMLDNLK